jgi:glycerol-3-phosphate dehydrogenase (NAD(P)+)
MNMIAEGYYATESIHALASELKISTPIISAVYSVVYEGKSAKTIFSELAAGLN